MTANEKALIALLVAAFLLSKSDIAALATLIATARLDSAKASYRLASSTVGTDATWEPDKEFQHMVSDVSEKDAQSISDTYKDDLEAVASAFVAGWLLDHETLDGCEKAARESLANWTKQRAEWKSEQVANWTCGSGANDGTELWLGDLVDGDLDLPEGMEASDVEIEIRPSESSGDFCKDYAGQRFAVDDDSVPSFPAHANCIHRKVVVLKEE